MPIYNRALSAGRMKQGQATSLLGTGQPAQLPERPPIPQVEVGDVNFLRGQIENRELGQQQQQQLMGSLLQLAQLGVSGYGAYSQGAFGGRPRTGDSGYMLGYNGYAPGFRGY